MTRRLLAALTLAALLAAPAAAQTPPAPVGAQHELVFDDYTPLSGNPELFRRLLSPLAAALAQKIVAQSGRPLAAQSVDLRQERFFTYAPPQPPPGGYGLLVFVPPWETAAMPAEWAAVMDRHGMIYVSAARSGNAANVMARREPLALLAYANVAARYRLDPARTYVGGFSGGSRIALRLALGYPDLFHGALLNAGSDPMGGGAPPVPPQALLEQLQTGSRFVYVTGERDETARRMDADSQRTMRRWCISDLVDQPMLWTGHAPASATALDRALTALEAHATPDPARLAACRAEAARDAAASLARIEALLAAGKAQDARKQLLKTDLEFGGLAAPKSLELARACGCGLL